MDQPELHGKCVTTTQSCRTDPFLVVLKLNNEHKKGIWRERERVGKAVMQGDTGAKVESEKQDKERQAQAQCSTKRAEGI
jgi:hypothetical protein